MPRYDLLVVIGTLDLGGCEKHLLTVLPALARRTGMRIAVMTLLREGALAPAMREAGVDVILPYPPFLRRLEALGRPGRLARHGAGFLCLWLMLARRQAAIVHFFLPQAYVVGGIAAWLARHPRRVMSRRSLSHYQAAHPLATAIERKLHPQMRAILGNSQAILAELESEGAPPSRLRLIYNGVAVAAAPTGDLRAATREQLGLPAAALVLIIVANLIPYKGHADLIDALASVEGSLPEGWTLLCVGRDDGIGPDLQARAERLGLAGSVRLLGSRSDVPALLAAADIGILCSHEEGFSNSLLEAMQAGLPVVATAVGGNVEAIADGESGLLVPPRAPAALGAAIASLATSPERRGRIGRAARARVEEEFSLESCVGAYAELYRSLGDGRN